MLPPPTMSRISLELFQVFVSSLQLTLANNSDGLEFLPLEVLVVIIIISGTQTEELKQGLQGLGE